MKKLLSILICLFTSSIVFATDQQPDYLYYKGKKLTLGAGMIYPTPLETYFPYKNTKSPFTGGMSDNWRGHINTWKIAKNKLYLKDVNGQKPADFNITSNTGTVLKDGSILADWFSGVISCEKYSMLGAYKSYNFHIRYGEVVQVEVFGYDNYTPVMNAKDSAVFIRQEKMIDISENYTS